MPSDLVQIEESIQQRLEAERQRLERLAGLDPAPRQQFSKPREDAFTRAQRDTTTILFGGLTWKHERLITAALRRIGYQAESLPDPDVRAFQAGKEYGNNGQCNPTYFTVGSLVRYLQSLEKRGLTRRQIIDRYVFVTAGACGPCRFGMYEAEHRLALRNSGFDGFRVVLFQQSGGLTQSDLEAGIAINANFFFGFLNALLVGDVVNQAGHATRPYETTPGATDEWVKRSVDLLAEDDPGALPWSLPEGLRRRLGRLAAPVEHLGKFSRQLRGDLFVGRLRRSAGLLDSIDVDRLRVKPVVKITGEFWAQTTEGDGNFKMFRFLENEGAEVLVEPIATWITYMVHQVVQRYHDTKGLEEGATLPGWTRPLRRARVEARHLMKMARMKVAEAIFTREYHRLGEPFQRLVHHLADQYELQRIAHPYYNTRAAGGEGHLEVAKNIHYLNRDLAHMVLSLKPFGCMPSTQSDAVQSAVAARFPDMIYLPIETSGEGEINAHSRVQMALGEARNKARAEFEKTLSDTNQTLDECYAYVESHTEMKRALYRVPHHKGVAGLAANFVLHIAERRGLRI